jgi:hypothetical protein
MFTYSINLMPSINNFFLDLLHDDYTKYNCFIETRTLNGETFIMPIINYNKINISRLIFLSIF